ncbi:MAG: helix-turn-helix domain-containing protein [Flavobacterium sp.]|nr:helix-turn-helix domain-containing protein [Flavobacterium sp.]
MKTKITLHFYTRSKNANTSGKLPIYVRLAVNGERLEFSSKKFIEQSKWLPDLAKMKGQLEEARSINSYLDMMRTKVLGAALQLIHKKEELTIENFQSILLDNENSVRMLIPIFQDHNDKMKELLGKKYAPPAVLIQKVQDHIVNHLEEALPSTKELAQMFGINDFILKQSFLGLFETSIYQFYNDKRLKKARLLIEQTTIPLANIASLAGFNHYINFYKAFKKKYSQSPSDII